MTAPAHLRRILVVEDEGVVAADIERCLEDAGYEVTGVAASAAEAMAEACRAKPDLALMDIRIQGAADGIEAGTALHRRFGVPVIYLTAQSDQETLERAKAAEPLAFLMKPFKPVELTSTVEIALERASAEQEMRERERSLLAAMGSIGDAVVSTGPLGHVEFMNPAAETLTGWSAGEASGRPMEEIVREIARTAQAGAAAWGARATECQIVSRGGAVRWISARATSLTRPDGGHARVNVMQDITARKETERLLQRQADLLDQSHEPIFTWQQDRGIDYWNFGSEKVYGFTREEAIGRDPHDLLKTEHPTGLAVVDRELELEGRWRGELGQRTKDGRRITVESLMLVVREPDGKGTVLETNRDVTDRKRAEEEVRSLVIDLERRVRERTSELETANKELESFAYSVSHDLRAPLRGIDGWSLALAEDFGSLLDETGRQYVARVRGEAQRMGMLIDDLLKLSRVTRTEMYRESLDLTSLACSSAARLSELHKTRRIEFVIANVSRADGDARLLDIAITNLFENAIKFTGKCADARIEFGETSTEQGPAFYVRDNGVGFDMTHAAKLFTAFQRLHKASEFPGTGIGLTTVARIVHRHGGRIWAESAPDRGATFYFSLGG